MVGQVSPLFLDSRTFGPAIQVPSIVNRGAALSGVHVCWTGTFVQWENKVQDVCVRMLGGYVVAGMGKK